VRFYGLLLGTVFCLFESNWSVKKYCVPIRVRVKNYIFLFAIFWRIYISLINNELFLKSSPRKLFGISLALNDFSRHRVLPLRLQETFLVQSNL
jgi:hypothetical protein